MALENGEKKSTVFKLWRLHNQKMEVSEKWTKNGATVSRQSIGEYIRREPGFL